MTLFQLLEITQPDITSIDFFLKAIVDYGITVVGTAVFFILAILLFKKFFKQQDQFQKLNQEMIQKNQELSERNQTMLIQVVTALNAGHGPEEEDENLELNLNIDSLLRELQEKANCDRAALFLYHNGGRDLSGRPFQNVSCTNEVVANKGVHPMISEIQRMPRGIFTSLMAALKSSGNMYIENISELSLIDPSTCKIFEDYGTKSLYVEAIHNSSDFIIGFTLITYAINDAGNPDIAIEHIKKTATKLEGLFHNVSLTSSLFMPRN